LLRQHPFPLLLVLEEAAPEDASRHGHHPSCLSLAASHMPRYQ
jgi:hypothetical protein